MTAFEQAFTIVVGTEGGFGCDAADRGNWTGGACGVGTLRGTKYGISAAAYPALDIANLTLDQSQELYKSDYWDKIRGDDLHPAFALLVFDAAVNNGPGRAVSWLQAAVHTTPDGVIGPLTIAAAATGGANALVEFQARRLLFMASLSIWPRFGPGWARRLCRLPYQAMSMGDAA